MRASGRDNHGRFALGNRGGLGRPPIAKERQYLEALTKACTLKDWRAICRRAVDDAKAGDHRARDWCGKYLIGDPRHLYDTPGPGDGRPVHGHGAVEPFERKYPDADPELVIKLKEIWWKLEHPEGKGNGRDGGGAG